MYVGGDLRAEGVVYGYSNDFTFEVEVESYHPPKAQLRAARDVFLPQVDDGGAKRAGKGLPPKLRRPSHQRVCRRLREGKPLFHSV
ncbi:hypothetical protein [Streptomyces sp. NBC_00105]|uniref:hypothetical protein n=1 Tax=Streptomyces sp. NBC_00105 TaxID=2903622 RepID=UPI00324AFB79